MCVSYAYVAWALEADGCGAYHWGCAVIAYLVADVEALSCSYACWCHGYVADAWFYVCLFFDDFEGCGCGCHGVTSARPHIKGFCVPPRLADWGRPLGEPVGCFPAGAGGCGSRGGCVLFRPPSVVRGAGVCCRGREQGASARYCEGVRLFQASRTFSGGRA